MATYINVLMTASADSDFEPSEERLILLSPDLTLQVDANDRTWTFRKLTDRQRVEIDLSKCSRLELGFMDLDANIDLPMEVFENDSFIDVINALMKREEIE